MSETGYGKYSHTTEETVEQSSSCDTDESQNQCGSWGSGNAGLWVAVIVLIIIWTIAVGAGWSVFNKSCRDGHSGKNDGFGASGFGAGLLWLIVLVLFIGAAWSCGWGAVVGLLVLFLILILIGMWWWCASC